MKRDLYSEVTAKIVAKLEAGALPWKQGWTGKAGAIPMNAISERPYSGINVLLYWASLEQGWARPRFLTFKQAKEAGGYVRAGEKGMPLYFFKQLEVTDKASGEDKTIPMLRQYTVFNVAQCDNLPDRIATGEFVAPLNQDQRNAWADHFIASTGADFREGIGAPCYVPSRDFISMPTFGDFHSQPDFYAVAFHELAHWTGHKSRLDRDLKGRFDKQAYAMEELVAELTSAFLCAEFGFDNRVDNHAAYLESWIKCLQADPRAIFTVSSKASKAAEYLRSLAIAEPLKIAA